MAAGGWSAYRGPQGLAPWRGFPPGKRIAGPTDDPPCEDPVDETPTERPVDCSWNVDCGWNVPPEEQPLTQAARARWSAILRQPHASCACTSVIDISKNNCAVATTTVERVTPGTPFDGYIKRLLPRDTLKQSKIVSSARFLQ